MAQRPPDDEIRIEREPRHRPEVTNIMSVTAGMMTHHDEKKLEQKFVFISTFEILLGSFFTLFGIVILAESVALDESRHMGEYLGVVGTGIFIIVSGASKKSKTSSWRMLRLFMLMSLLSAGMLAVVLTLHILILINRNYQKSPLLAYVISIVSAVTMIFCLTHCYVYRMAMRAPERKSEAMLYTDIDTGDQYLQMAEKETRKPRGRSQSNQYAPRMVPVTTGTKRSKSSSDLMKNLGPHHPHGEPPHPHKKKNIKRGVSDRVPMKQTGLYQNYKMPPSILAQGSAPRGPHRPHVHFNPRHPAYDEDEVPQSRSHATLPPGYYPYAMPPYHHMPMPEPYIPPTSGAHRGMKQTRFADEEMQLAVVSRPYVAPYHYPPMPQPYYHRNVALPMGPPRYSGASITEYEEDDLPPPPPEMLTSLPPGKIKGKLQHQNSPRRSST